MKLLISLAILSSVTPGLGQAAGECCPPSQLQGTAAFRGLVLKEEGADPYSVSIRITMMNCLPLLSNIWEMLESVVSSNVLTDLIYSNRF